MSDLDRFVKAQRCYYSRALEEIRNGRKESHWIWYIYPQIKGLGFSPESKLYAIQDRAEAEEYLDHETLGPRLVEMCNALLECGKDDIGDIMGYPDDQKVRSCVTLFRAVRPSEPVFDAVLSRFFGGEPDTKTLELLEQ